MGLKTSKSIDLHTKTHDRVNPDEIPQILLMHGPLYRLAIDQSADIGSFYNAREDLFLQELQLPILRKVRPEEVTSNPSESILIDPELLMSIKLNLINDDQLSSLLNHRPPSNNLTKNFTYHYIDRMKSITGRKDLLQCNIEQILNDAIATHVVTEVSLGIFVYILIEFPSSDEFHLDVILKKITDSLEGNHFNFSDEEKEILERINSTKIFSNLSQLSQLTKLTDIYEQLLQIRRNPSVYQPVRYTLRSIVSLIHSNPERYQYTPLASTMIKKIDKHLQELARLRESMDISLTSKEKQCIDEYLQDPYNRMEKLVSKGDQAHQMRLNDVRDAVKMMRAGVYQRNRLVGMNINQHEEMLESMVRTIQNEFNDLKRKIRVVKSLKRRGIIYLNVKTKVNDDDENLERIKEQLVRKNNQADIFCFDDKFDKVDSQLWKLFYRKLIAMMSENRHHNLIYADFSYCTCTLTSFEELLLEDHGGRVMIRFKESSSNVLNFPREPLSSRASSVMKSTESLFQSGIMDLDINPVTKQSAPSQSKETYPKKHERKVINVLLLGESGVGKSTFINALVNYLQFEDFQAAHSGEPIVLTPISFLMTQGDNFEEHIVTFGKQDPNENHNNTGQSVTQHCRSYVFTVGTNTKLRLIDTPGMGDTRGLDQDDRNMEHILSFISNLSHLNAICILLKPNESRLNVVLRSYFTRLVGFLGEHVRHNIIFCFSNTRSTFYAPGNTGPLLKAMLQSHSIKDIPYKKDNTFCFDSESFRYLVARMNGIVFDDYQKDEYERSWITSASESHRLLGYICSELKSYSQKEWQSIEHAQFELRQLTRPLLETFTNLCRNLILRKQSPTEGSIEFFPKRSSESSTICFVCPFTTQRIDRFLIVNEDLHTFTDQCNKCDCHRKDHLDVEYQLHYEHSDQTNTDNLTSMLEEVEEMIGKSGWVIRNIVHCSEEDDPIMRMINLIIRREKDICSSGEEEEEECLNPQLLKKLEQLKDNYEERRTNLDRENGSIDLECVYEMIERIGRIDFIRKQQDVTEKYRKAQMEQQEKELTFNI